MKRVKMRTLLVTAALTAIFSVTTFAECDHSNLEQGSFSYPTCTEDGFYDVVCVDCGMTTRTAIPSGGHVLVYHEYPSSECGTMGYVSWECSECGYTEGMYTQDLAPDHVFGEQQVALAPTCTTAGMTEVFCMICGKAQLGRELPALGHRYDKCETIAKATCTQDGIIRYTCVECGETFQEYTGRADHVFTDWETTVKPTDHSMGAKKSFCVNCGYTYTEDIIPKGTIMPGERNETDVFVLQELLLKYGYLNDIADGIYGNLTKEAVRNAQAEFEFEETGIAYPQTFQKMIRKLTDEMNSEKKETIELGKNIDVTLKETKEGDKTKRSISFTRYEDTFTWDLN